MCRKMLIRRIWIAKKIINGEGEPIEAEEKEDA
jgi:hypothetical protein